MGAKRCGEQRVNQRAKKPPGNVSDQGVRSPIGGPTSRRSAALRSCCTSLANEARIVRIVFSSTRSRDANTAMTKSDSFMISSY